MTLHSKDQLPLALQIPDKRDVRTQFGALCYRMKAGQPQVLMITSRRTGRWIIPKGWPIEGKTPGDSALREAWEEAGVRGKVAGPCLALFSYSKGVGTADKLPCVVMVYPVKVNALADDFPETGQRKRRWMSLKKAAKRVNEPELAHLLKTFDPRRL
ncbi:NUDIX hydrolase [Roseovarius sp.]|uniref:NUDIX hydrolase n=1 Tax=Roseovarius sp. TaxID=1486281 RepID=UPI003B5ACF5B